MRVDKGVAFCSFIFYPYYHKITKNFCLMKILVNYQYLINLSSVQNRGAILYDSCVRKRKLKCRNAFGGVKLEQIECTHSHAWR